MKVLFILASDLIYKYKNIFTVNNGFAPLSLTTLAALIPTNLNPEIMIVDEGMQRVNYSKYEFDLVCISCCASSSNRAYELSKYWQKRGAYTVIGGHHATLCPDDVSQHCNTVLVGYGETIFPKFIQDFIHGNPQKRYIARYNSEFLSSPIQRRDLIKHIPYYAKNTIVANRGCSNKCSYCSIGHFACHNTIKRPITEVVNEIKQENLKKVWFLDPSIASDIDYAKELFSALIPLKISYYIDISLQGAKDSELLDLMQKSGCFQVFIGFESFNLKNLESSNKEFNKTNEFKTAIENFHSRNILITGSFMVGMDFDTEESILLYPNYVEDLGVDLVRYTVFTPIPGTQTYREYFGSNRLLTSNFDYYDLMHVVHKPKNIEPERLQYLYYKIWHDTYSTHRILARTIKSKRNKLELGLENLYFKILGEKIPKKILYTYPNA